MISDHPGFDPKCSIGLLTLHIKQKLEIDESADCLQVDKKEIVNMIGENLIEHNNIEKEIRKKNEDGLFNELNETDDGSIHKFINITFTESKMCEFCNKKVGHVFFSYFYFFSID